MNSEQQIVKSTDILEALKKFPFMGDLQQFKRLVIVARGGLGAASYLSQFLKTRDFTVISISSYSSDREQQQLTPHTNLSVVQLEELDNSDTLIVEDMVDSGETLRYLISILPKAKTFALHCKMAKTDIIPDYYLWQTDKWIVYPWELG